MTSATPVVVIGSGMPIELDPKALTESAARGAQEEEALGSKNPRGAHAFEARADGSLIIYATTRGKYADVDLIRVEPHQVAAVLSACGDALARKPSTR
jgi:hypothetical protein